MWLFKISAFLCRTVLIIGHSNPKGKISLSVKFGKFDFPSFFFFFKSVKVIHRAKLKNCVGSAIVYFQSTFHCTFFFNCLN